MKCNVASGLARASAIIMAAAGAMSVSCVFAQTPCVLINAYGADPTGTNDSAPAFYSAVAAASSLNYVCISAEAGKYKFNSALSFSYGPSAKGFTLVGQGSNTTIFYFPSTSGLSLTMTGIDQTFHIRGLTWTTGAIGQIGLTVSQSDTASRASLTMVNNDVTDVNFHGNDGYSDSDYWGDAILINSVSYINFFNDNFTGAGGNGLGVNLVSTSSQNGVVYNFTDDNFSFNNVAILYGTYIQGVTVSQSNFTGDNVGILTNSGESGLDQLTVIGGQFNENSEGIYELTYIPNNIIQGNLFIVNPGSIGVSLAQADIYAIYGNTFNSGSSLSNNTGISIGSNLNNRPGTIAGNIFNGMANYAIELLSTSRLNTISPDNSFNANGTNIINSGTNNVVPVSCSAAPSSSFDVNNGIITHC